MKLRFKQLTCALFGVMISPPPILDFSGELPKLPTVDEQQQPPSGPWIGFYLENHHAKKAWMNLCLDFANSTISGQGTDYVGPWTISGSFSRDTAECVWVKQYLGKHRVRYQGIWGKMGIRGRWMIGSLISGDFHIWPAEYTEIQAAYLAQEAQENPLGRRQE